MISDSLHSVSKATLPRRHRRKSGTLQVGPPCPHYPHKYKFEALHQARLEYRRNCHARQYATSLEYRLKCVLAGIIGRCTDPKIREYRWYGARGIKNFLTLEHLFYLWHRDNAASMKRPSIDRKKSRRDYSIGNCRFIESSENTKRSWANREARLSAQACPNGHPYTKANTRINSVGGPQGSVGRN